MGTIVNIDDLSPEVRAAAVPGTSLFTAYAKHYEEDWGLPKGSLTAGVFKLTPDTDPLAALQSVAVDIQKNPGNAPAPNPKLVPLSDLPPGFHPPATAAAAPAKPEYDPTEADYQDVGPLHLNLPAWAGNAAAGVGKAFNDTAEGLHQLLTPKPDVKLSDLITNGGKPTDPLQASIDEHRTLDAPLLNNAAGLTGNIAGQVGMMAGAPELAAGRPILNAALTGAAFNATQPVATGETRTGNAELGGALGAAGAGVFALGHGVVDAAAKTEAAKALKAKADAMGIQLTAGQLSNSPWLQAANYWLNKLPFLGSAKSDAQKAELGTYMSRTMGQTDPDAAKAVVGARKDLGDTYNLLKQKYDLQLEPWHVDALQGTVDDYGRLSGTASNGTEVANQLRSNLNTIVNATDANGVIPGADYQTIRSNLGNLANASKDGAAKGAYKAQQRILDQAHYSGMSPEDQALKQLTDRQWSNMRTLEAVAPKSGAGDFDFQALPRVMAQRNVGNSANRNALLFGQGNTDLADAAHLAPIVGRDVNTPSTVSPWMQLGRAGLKTGETAAIGGGLYALNHGNDSPFTDTAKELGAVLLAAKLGGKAMNSAWFANGLPRAQAALGAAEKGGLSQLGTAYGNTAKDRVPIDYDAYLKAYDAAPDWETKKALGEAFAASQAGGTPP